VVDGVEILSVPLLLESQSGTSIEVPCRPLRPIASASKYKRWLMALDRSSR
jgi:hypothetical protein